MNEFSNDDLKSIYDGLSNYMIICGDDIEVEEYGRLLNICKILEERIEKDEIK